MRRLYCLVFGHSWHFPLSFMKGNIRCKRCGRYLVGAYG